jgi:hypothetical protein
MLIAAFILVITVAALVQFAAFTWRAGLLQTASEPLPNEAESYLASRNLLKANNFSDISALEGLCLEVGADTGASLRSVRLYYRFLQFLSSLGSSVIEASTPTGWTNREMALCTRYATVVLSQRIERNYALATEIRSY